MSRRNWSVFAVAIGLIAAACSSGGATTPTIPSTLPPLETTTTTAPPPETTTSTTAGPETLWEAGTCVDLGTNGDTDLPYAPYGTGLVVDCSGPHTHEVYFMETLPEGPDDPYPEDLNDRLFAVCYQTFAERMGYPPSESTLFITLYLPDEDEWAAGERYHGCVIDQEGTQVVYRPLVGSVFDHPDDYRWQVEAGDCYDELEIRLLFVAEPASCDELHTVEAMGAVEPLPPNADFPGDPEFADLADEACATLLTEYAGQDIQDLPLVAFALPLNEGEWDAGGRSVQCFVIAATDEQGLQLMRGSLGDGTLEVVSPDDAVTA